MAKRKPKEEYSRPITPGTRLKKLLAAKRRAQQDMDEANGAYRSELAEAVEKHHLNKVAYAVIVRCDKMEPVKLKLFLEDLHAYLDSTGIQKRADDVSMMDLQQHIEGEDGEDGEGGDGEDESERRTADVRKFPAPAATAAE